VEKFGGATPVRIRSSPRTIHLVDDRPHIRLTVLVEPGVEPIRGCVWIDGRCEPFCGWLELSTTIERARDAASDGIEEKPCRR
jgi:hypothetical protein